MATITTRRDHLQRLWLISESQECRPTDESEATADDRAECAPAES